MSRRRADHEAGFVLHTYAYKETSLIVEAFTRAYGRVALLARGARRPRSAMRGVLLSFHPLRLSWSGSAELGTLMACEWAGGHLQLSGRGLMCGFYLNELILRLLPREDPHEALYEFYQASLRALSDGADQGPVLRAFERRLLAELGYAPVLDRDSADEPIEAAALYVYEPDRGPRRANGRSGDLVIHGQTLLDLAHDAYERAETREEARFLMRALIGERLHGQVLHTRTVLMELHDL